MDHIAKFMTQHAHHTGLTVGISTTRDRLTTLSMARLPQHGQIDYLIVVQALTPCPAGQKSDDVPTHLCRADITVRFDTGQGIARSRNQVINAAQRDLLWFADDDLEFEASGLQNLITAFGQQPDAAVLTFQSANADGSLRKAFGNKHSRIAKHNAGRYATFEIAIRPATIRDAAVAFDTNFGIGSRYSFGDEYVFLSDCIDAGLICRYVPFVLAIHPTLSTGFRKVPKRLRTERAIFARVFGGLWPVWFVAFIVKKHMRYLRTRFSSEKKG